MSLCSYCATVSTFRLSLLCSTCFSFSVLMSVLTVPQFLFLFCLCSHSSCFPTAPLFLLSHGSTLSFSTLPLSLFFLFLQLLFLLSHSSYTSTIPTFPSVPTLPLFLPFPLVFCSSVPSTAILPLFLASHSQSSQPSRLCLLQPMMPKSLHNFHYRWHQRDYI